MNRKLLLFFPPPPCMPSPCASFWMSPLFSGFNDNDHKFTYRLLGTPHTKIGLEKYVLFMEKKKLFLDCFKTALFQQIETKFWETTFYIVLSQQIYHGREGVFTKNTSLKNQISPHWFFFAKTHLYHDILI